MTQQKKEKKNVSNLFHVKIDPKSIANRVVSLHTDYNAKKKLQAGANKKHNFNFIKILNQCFSTGALICPER